MEVKNESAVIQRLVDMGMRPEAVQNIRRSLATGEEKISQQDYQIIEGDLYVYDAELKVGNSQLFFNGMKVVQIPGFRSYPEKGLDTAALIGGLMGLRDKGGPAELTEQLQREHIDKNSEGMNRLRELNKGLFHRLGGVLQPLLRGMDADTNNKMLQADAALTKRRWFPAREWVSMEQAAYLLKGRSVKATVHEPLNRDELTTCRAIDIYVNNNTALRAHLNAQELKDVDYKWDALQNQQNRGEELPVLPRGWDSTGQRHHLQYDVWYDINFKGKLTQNNNLPILTMYEEHGFYLEEKLREDFRFRNLQDPEILKAAVKALEDGKKFIATTYHPDHEQVFISANATKGTIHIQGEEGEFLPHRLFRTEFAQDRADERDLRWSSRHDKPPADPGKTPSARPQDRGADATGQQPSSAPGHLQTPPSPSHTKDGPPPGPSQGPAGPPPDGGNTQGPTSLNKTNHREKQDRTGPNQKKIKR